MRKYSYEKLEVWQLARELVKEVYSLSKSFPNEEKFGLTNQIRRASVSIASNIAESTSRMLGKDKIRFIVIAYGSLMEVSCQLTLACDLDFISLQEMNNLRSKIEELSNKLNALRKAYQSKSTDK